MGDLKTKDPNTRKADLIKAIGDICDKHNLPEPALFLAEVMAGKDPREPVSRLYKAVDAVTEGERPTADQWQAIRDMVLNDPAFMPRRLDADTSIKAAERLVDYMHPKLKAIEVSAQVAATVAITKPLTAEEIEEFGRKWSGEF